MNTGFARMNELPALERRITLRLLAYWERLRGARPMPLEQEIDPDHLQDVWESCFLMHINDISQKDHQYLYLGELLREWLGHPDASQNIAILKEGYPKVAATGRPLVEEGEFLNAQGKLVKFRQCLLPLGAEGQVQAILGGVRFKQFG